MNLIIIDFSFDVFSFIKKSNCDLFINEISIKINFSQDDCRFVLLYNKEKYESF